MTHMLTIVILVYLLIMTIVGIIVMKVDKVKAEKQKWRIKERSLFLVSLLGGSLGTWLGMYIFRHKTKHWYFVVFMPLILILHVVLIAYLFSQGYLAL